MPSPFDTLQRVMDSLREEGRVHIGVPTVVAFLPDSEATLDDPDVRALRRSFTEALPRLRDTAVAAGFRFAVHRSPGLVLWSHRGGPIAYGSPGGAPLGLLIAAPNYPAMRMPGVPAPAALADTLARYAVMIGMPRPPRRGHHAAA